MKRLVLLGGGHAHVHVLKAIGDALDPAVSVTLVTPVERQVYSGMVPGFVAGHYGLAECGIDLGPLATRARALVVRSSAALVNPAMREVVCANGEIVPYDVLSIDVGSRPFVGGARGVAEHAIAIRPLESFVDGWERVLARARGGGMGSVSVVGGGAAGIELALAMDYRFRKEAGEGAPHVRILTDARMLLPEHTAAVRGRLLRIARSHNVGLHVQSLVAEVGPGFLRLKDNIEFATDATFWVTGATAHEFIRDSGFVTDERGFLGVNEFMQSVSHPEVFGAGDCATDLRNPRAKAGVFAVRAGPALVANLFAALHGGPLERQVPARRFLALISCGGHYAVGVYGGFSFEGGWVWRWKDHIDRRFIARYAPEALASNG
ncbi:MAG TPA: FAD-dependent oxidoreductase [Usitatibacteraceae bacterium]|nr:FAD-dependent oxidoreductase [Usitatibacteraceae bacterium]